MIWFIQLTRLSFDIVDRFGSVDRAYKIDRFDTVNEVNMTELRQN